jgi:predicted nucleotidyltransferase
LAAAAREVAGETMRHYFEAFIDDLRSTHGRNLASVILYGSAAAGDFIPSRSDYNILVALHRIAPKDLRNAHACIREWARMGHPVPVYFTVPELRHAADVFPIEFHQMEAARTVLYGDDVLEGLQISDKFLRHQTEFELRSKLIQLRRQYIPASVSVGGLARLMSESLASFASLFRAVLLLDGIDPPATKHEIVALTIGRLGIDGTVFEKIFNIRENNFATRLDEVEANDLFADYMEQIESVIASVDKMRRSEPSEGEK